MKDGLKKVALALLAAAAAAVGTALGELVRDAIKPPEPEVKAKKTKRTKRRK